MQSLAQYVVMRKNVMGFARNYEIMGISKGQTGEMACPPYSLMADMELAEGNK